MVYTDLIQPRIPQYSKNNLLITLIIEIFKENTTVVRTKFWGIPKGYQGAWCGRRCNRLPSGAYRGGLVFQNNK